jgi:hypothetical protein
VRILFFMRSTVYARNFESTLRLLADRGHQVHIVGAAHHVVDPGDLVGRLCEEYAGITRGEPPPAAATEWERMGIELRRGLDYLRYLESDYAGAPKLRRRAELKAPPVLLTGRGRRLTASRAGRGAMRRVMQGADRLLPRAPRVEAFIRGHRPDLVIVTPLVEPGSPQSVFLRAARALGIRTALCVYSWDNLTNKGLIHDPLDVVTVWNDAMRDEAIRLHHVPAERIAVTGAAAYDHWFAWKPNASREAFTARVGLDAARPYLLYLCSSKFIAPDERPFIARWIREIRAASPVLRDAGVLVRPHPQHPVDWTAAELDALPNVSVWPRAGANPADVESRAEYYDSIHHSAAVVGINTSAQIESAIVGRGVFTVLTPEFADTQEGTLHFRHLRTEGGGLLHVAEDIATHAAQLEQAVRDPRQAAERCRRFVERFVRPFGLDEPAAPRVVAALEAAAARQPLVDRPPLWALATRPLLLRAASALTAVRSARPVIPAPPRLARVKKRPVAVAPAPDQAYDHYLHARDHLAALRAAEAAAPSTADERHVLAALEPLWTADRGTIASLRRGVEAAGVARHIEYAGASAGAAQRRLDRDLRRLFKMGEASLWIEEPAVLGGFGVSGRRGLYNDDSVRYFRVLSLLQDAAVLRHFRGAQRRTVWEIGGGWGGFAYQFTRVCPNTTYLITAAPTLLLASAVYLRTLRPDARVRFYDPARPDEFWADWAEVDFAFAPESAVATLQPSSLDLAVDLGTLDQFTAPRVAAHVQQASALLATYFFSICGAASTVRSEIERLYWPHPVSAPGYLARRLALPKDVSYLLGWRRLLAPAP